jgi:hypothetical protein
MDTALPIGSAPTAAIAARLATAHDRVAQLLTELVHEELTARTTDRKPAVPIDLVVTGVVGAYLALSQGWSTTKPAPRTR